MKKLLLLSLILFLPASAKAEEYSAVCQVLAEHHPENNVIHKGNADIATTNYKVPDIIKVPLTVDLAKRVASLTGKNVQLEAPLGTDGGMVEIHQNGKIFYNGQNWTAPVMTLCGQSHMVVETIEATPSEPVEQKPILNRSKILNNKPVINRASASDRAGQVSAREDRSEHRQVPVEVIKSQAAQVAVPRQEAKTSERALIEVSPTRAIPPQDVNTAIEREIKIKEPELIEGGEYREIFYND